MDDAAFIEVSAWLTQAGLGGDAETEMVAGFCERCVAAGLPLGRALLFSTRCIRSMRAACSAGVMARTKPAVLEYGRTSPEALAAAGFDPGDVEAAERWRTKPVLPDAADWRVVVAPPPHDESVGRILAVTGVARSGYDGLCRHHHPLCRRGVIGEMDGVYTAWGTRDARRLH